MSIKSEVKQVKTNALNQLATMRDEARVKLHLLSLDARKRWDELETSFTTLEQHIDHEGDKASESLHENVNKLSRSFAEFIGNQMSSSGLLTNVRSLMTTPVKACSADDSLARAAQVMWESDCGIVPVTDDGRAVGLVTDRDICMATYTQGKPPAEIRIGSAMSKRVFTCSEDDSIGSALSVMAQQRVRRLPVTNGGGQLVGMLTLADVARWARGAATPGVEAALSDTLSDISERTIEAERTAAE